MFQETRHTIATIDLLRTTAGLTQNKQPEIFNTA